MLPSLKTGEENSQTEFGNLPPGKILSNSISPKFFYYSQLQCVVSKLNWIRYINSVKQSESHKKLRIVSIEMSSEIIIHINFCTCM